MNFFSSVRSALWSKSALLLITIFLETDFRCFLPRILISWFTQPTLLSSFSCGLVLDLTYDVLKILVLKFSEIYLFHHLQIFQIQISLLIVVQNLHNLGIHMDKKCWTSSLYYEMQPVKDSNKHDLGKDSLKRSWLIKWQTTLSNYKYLHISVSVRFWWSSGKASKSVS